MFNNKRDVISRKIPVFIKHRCQNLQLCMNLFQTALMDIILCTCNDPYLLKLIYE